MLQRINFGLMIQGLRFKLEKIVALMASGSSAFDGIIGTEATCTAQGMA